MRPRWTAEDDATADRILVESDDLAEALGQIGVALGRVVTKKSIDNRREQRGLGSAWGAIQETETRDTEPAPPFSDYTDSEAHAIDEAMARIGLTDTRQASFSNCTTSSCASAGSAPSVAHVPADRTFIDRGDTPEHHFAPLDLGSRTTERVLLIPDTHSNYHDARAWALVMKFAREFRPDTIVHLGDFADCFAVSAHDRDPRRGSQFEDEIKVTRELRAELDSLGAERKIITLGNHEHRLERYLMRQAPALLSMLNIAELMQMPQNGWRVVPYMTHGRLGKMYIAHDAGFAGIHAVHHTANAFASSIIFGHTHRLGCNYFGSVTGKRHISASLGWLGSAREARYVPEVTKRYWSLGFGTAYMMPDGKFQLQLVPIVEYRCIRDGQTVELP